MEAASASETSNQSPVTIQQRIYDPHGKYLQILTQRHCCGLCGLAARRMRRACVNQSPNNRINGVHGLYLQRLKLSLDDPDSFMSNWNERDDTPCNWNGIKCDSTSHSVNSVDLSKARVAGQFPTVLCRLRNLTFLSLSNNSINSSLPSNISACQSLVHLDLSQNLLIGELPVNLADLHNLKYLDLSGNNFTGDVPASFRRHVQRSTSEHKPTVNR
ncbi:hypothetical protein Ancab_026284 [Ancistrocladus abbreviatus]